MARFAEPNGLSPGRAKAAAVAVGRKPLNSAMTDKIWYLKQIDWLSQLTPEEAGKLESRAVTHGSAAPFAATC